MDEGKYQPQTDLIDIHEGVPPQKLGEIPPQTDLIQMDEGLYHPNQPAPRAPKAGEAVKKFTGVRGCTNLTPTEPHPDGWGAVPPQPTRSAGT